MSFLKTVFAPKNLLFTALSMAAVFGILGFLGQRDWVTDPVNKAKSLVG